YQAFLRKVGTGHSAIIVRCVNGVSTTIANDTAPTGRGLLRFDAVGSRLSLSLDGKLLVCLSDTAISGPGTAGTYVSTGAAASQFSMITLKPFSS
ncbi:MAG: hypothetical protein ACKOTB_14435, partial [Planctomycetia bacterium]